MVFNQEEICLWFKNLEGHGRIELICNLLDACLPLELRFIGTYLEYFAGKHYTHLHKWEKDANNNNVIDDSTNLLDQVTRRRLCIFLALLHSHNRMTATKFYMLLKSFEKLNMSENKDKDLESKTESSSTTNNSEIKEKLGGEENENSPEKLEQISKNNEMKLLFTMASYHPAFEFWQRENMRVRLKEFLKECRKLEEKDKLADEMNGDLILITTKESPTPQVSTSTTQVTKSPLLPSPSPSMTGLPPTFIEPFAYPPAAAIRPGSLPPLMIPTPIHIIGQQNGPILNQNNVVPLPADEKQTTQIVPMGADNLELRNVVLTPMSLHPNPSNSQFGNNVKPVSNYIVNNETFYPPLMNDLNKVIPNGPVVTPSVSSEITQPKTFPISSVSEDKHPVHAKEMYRYNNKRGDERRCLSESEMYSREASLPDGNYLANDAVFDGRSSVNNNMVHVNSNIQTSNHSKNNILPNKSLQQQHIQNFQNVHGYQLIMPQNKYIPPNFVQNANLSKSLPHHSLPIFPINSTNLDKSNMGGGSFTPVSVVNPSKGSLPSHLDVIQTFDPLKPNHLIPNPLFPVMTSAFNLIYPVGKESLVNSMKLKDDTTMASGPTIATGVNGGYITRQMFLNGPSLPGKSYRKDSYEEKNYPVKSPGKSASSFSYPSISDKSVSAPSSSYLSVDKLSSDISYLNAASPKASPLNSPCQSPSTQRRGSQPKEIPNLSSTVDWLKSLRLHKYEDKFRDYTFEMLSQLEEDDLEELGLTKGARTKLLQHIDMLKRRGFVEFGQNTNHGSPPDIPITSPLVTSPSTPSNDNDVCSITDSSIVRYNLSTTHTDVTPTVFYNDVYHGEKYKGHVSNPTLMTSSNEAVVQNDVGELQMGQRMHRSIKTEVNMVADRTLTTLSNHVGEDHCDDEVFAHPPFPTKKRNSLSATCYNCGLLGHYGDECTEQTMEAQTYIRYAFHLDYSHNEDESSTTSSTDTSATVTMTTISKNKLTSAPAR